MNTFKLIIISTRRFFFDGEAQSLTLPHLDGGSECFLAHHENTIFPIVPGEMKIVDAQGNTIDAFVGDGFLEFIDNSAKMVVASAEHPEEIDERRANEAMLRAEEELRQKQSIHEYNLSQMNLARAMERLKVKNRHKI